MVRIPASLAGMFAVAALLAACAAPTALDSNARFDATSEKAIVVVGGSVFWTEDFRDPDQSLTLHWQAFDPITLRLLPEGEGFTSLTRAAVRMKISDPFPPAQVLQVEPGSYALVAAGSGISKTFYVPVQERYKSKWGLKRTRDRYIDPLAYIEPRAQLAAGKNYMISVEAGQVVYLGHFVFHRDSRYFSGLSLPRRVEDETAARKALQDFPGISGEMLIFDPSRPPQAAAR